MNVFYRIYEVPDLQSENPKTTKQARIDSAGTVRTEELCELISSRSTVSPADVKATLDSLNFCFNYYFSNGYSVELDDLGIFSLGLKSRNKQKTENKTVLDVSVGGVHFRPSVKLKGQIKAFKLICKDRKSTKSYTDEERLKRIFSYVEKQGYITRAECQMLNNVSRYIADSDLKLLVQDNSLKALGKTSNRLYIKRGTELAEL